MEHTEMRVAGEYVVLRETFWGLTKLGFTELEGTR